jgi:hypothetical protein
MADEPLVMWTVLARDGLVCLARRPEDDPVIVETWL